MNTQLFIDAAKCGGKKRRERNVSPRGHAQTTFLFLQDFSNPKEQVNNTRPPTGWYRVALKGSKSIARTRTRAPGLGVKPF
jgi:hypothetical protein